MPRLPTLERDDLNPEQLKVYDDIASSPRGGVRGPFNALLHSPGLADRVQKLGAFVRYDCSVPQKLREFAILITARHTKAHYEWFAHEPHARDAGLDDAIIEAVRAGTRPDAMDEAEQAVYEFCTEYYAGYRVSDGSYGRVVAAFGEQGAVDLVGLLGHYNMIAMTLNVFEISVPEGEKLLF